MTQNSKSPILDVVESEIRDHVAVNKGRQPIAWATSRGVLDAILLELQDKTGQPHHGDVLVRGVVLKVPGE